jgi:hypothetical protein
MPPRSKQANRQVDWLACQYCSCRFSNRDTELHSEVCSAELPFDTEAINPKVLKHGFVKEGVLVALLALADGNDSTRLFIAFCFYVLTLHTRQSVRRVT